MTKPIFFLKLHPNNFYVSKLRGQKNKPPAVYKPSDGNQGDSTLLYVLVKKSGVVPIGRLWNGFQSTVDSCR